MSKHAWVIGTGLGFGLRRRDVVTLGGGIAPDSIHPRFPRPPAKHPRSRSTSHRDLPAPVAGSPAACSSDCTRSRTNDSHTWPATRSGHPSPAQTHTCRSRSDRTHGDHHRLLLHQPYHPHSRSTTAPTAHPPAPPPRASAAAPPHSASLRPSPGHPARSPGDKTSDHPPVQQSKNATDRPDTACRESPQCRPAPVDRQLA